MIESSAVLSCCMTICYIAHFCETLATNRSECLCLSWLPHNRRGGGRCVPGGWERHGTAAGPGVRCGPDHPLCHHLLLPHPGHPVRGWTSINWMRLKRLSGETAPPAAHRLERHGAVFLVLGRPNSPISFRCTGRGEEPSVCRAASRGRHQWAMRRTKLLSVLNSSWGPQLSALAFGAAGQLWILHFVADGGVKSAEDEGKNQPRRHFLICKVHGRESKGALFHTGRRVQWEGCWRPSCRKLQPAGNSQKRASHLVWSPFSR